MVVINILLSTYNGERYLSEQIDSIINQTYPNWKLLIRDDGSTDKTITIINEYVGKDNRIEYINPLQVENVGVHKSFKRLAAYKKADYYFFCDQDDFWMPQKIEKMLENVGEFDSNIPQLLYSDFSSTDENLNVIQQNLRNPNGKFVNPPLKDVLVCNVVTGCTAMINNVLKELWLTNKEIVGYHDTFCGLLAVTFGKVHFLDEVLILYRQHSNNAAGIVSKKVKGVLTKFWDLNHTSTQRATTILKEYNQLLTDSQRKTLNDFVGLSKNNIFYRLKTVVNYRYLYSLGDWKYTLLMRILLIIRIGE
ncbi:glycosyltransferase family 2 protein [Lactococcus lactis]|uniref:glycosyltransferase family 2 protein n=1 Tax=Lactococcus lactis TaxID=1358 RepID=UPI00050D76F4|nr:glycosyltransferase family 2 protein [Lactococcus lactis]AIS02790.1 hypothetical protein LG36_0190 [Lactococcus lactis]RHJ27191.1 glycosyltransferase family 2 protein [Lactococcus lactis]